MKKFVAMILLASLSALGIGCANWTSADSAALFGGIAAGAAIGAAGIAAGAAIANEQTCSVRCCDGTCSGCSVIHSGCCSYHGGVCAN